MTATTSPATASSPLLQAMLNLTKFHREHEKFYASSPASSPSCCNVTHGACRRSRTSGRRANRRRGPPQPLRGRGGPQQPGGAPARRRALHGGRGPSDGDHPSHPGPAHHGRGPARHREWLARAMESSWDVAAALVGIDGLADVLGERHRIIANDWQAATMNTVMSRLLDRAADILDRVDFAPAALRADLATDGVSVGPLLGGRARLPRGGPVQRLGRPGPRQRAPVARLPAACGRRARRHLHCGVLGLGAWSGVARPRRRHRRPPSGRRATDAPSAWCRRRSRRGRRPPPPPRPGAAVSRRARRASSPPRGRGRRPAGRRAGSACSPASRSPPPSPGPPSRPSRARDARG